MVVGGGTYTVVLVVEEGGGGGGGAGVQSPAAIPRLGTAYSENDRPNIEGARSG